MGVLSKVLGVSSPRDAPSADNALRRRFGVQPCSITSISCAKAEALMEIFKGAPALLNKLSSVPQFADREC